MCAGAQAAGAQLGSRVKGAEIEMCSAQFCNYRSKYWQKRPKIIWHCNCVQQSSEVGDLIGWLVAELHRSTTKLKVL